MLRLVMFVGLVCLMLAPLKTRAASLSPSVIELSASRGETVEAVVTVINTSVTEQIYFAGVMRFEPSEDGSSPVFLQDEVGSGEWPNWIVLAFSEFRVPANSKAELPFKVVVPSDVQSGGYYGAVTVSQAPSDIVADNGAMIEAKTAALVLLTVEGETVEKVEVLELVGSGPFVYRMQNQGNVHVTPVGMVTVKDMFGRTVASYDANPGGARVLPGTTRTYETQQSDQNSWFTIGPMRAQLEVTYGRSEQTATAQTEFWYVPWKALVAVLVVLVALGFFVRPKSRTQNDSKKTPASQ